MQEQMLVSLPLPTKLNVFRLHHGILYSRWLGLSALFAITFGCLCCICWYLVPCPPGVLGIFCGIDTWGILEQCLLFCGILLFILVLGWLLSFLIGYRFIETPKPKSTQHSQPGRASRFFRSISDLKQLRVLLCFYALLVLSDVVYLCWQQGIQPLLCALVLIFSILAAWTVFNDAFRRWIKEEKEPLEEKEHMRLSARYLFRCLVKLRRNIPDTPGTTIAGMLPSSTENQ
jgi:hypothetical protein